LFLSAPRAAPTSNRWERGLLLVSFLLIASILQLFRAGPSDTLNSLWAEDGSVFLHGALTQGFLDAVTSAYAEYLVVVPRLIGEVGAIVPLRDAPQAMNVTAALVVALSGVAVWIASADHIRSPYLRGLLVALLVLTPAGSIEAVVSGTYVAWYMAFVAFWMLIWRPATTWGAALAALVILATGLSSPTLFFFAPLALLRALAIRDRRDAMIVGSFALAIAIQLPVTAASQEHVANPTWSADIVTTFLQRIVDGSVLGLELGGSAWEQWGWPFLIAISVGATLYLLVLAWRASSGRLLAAIALGTSALMFAASVYQRGLASAMLWPAGEHNGFGGRYAIVPSLLFISAALVLIDSPRREQPGNPAWAAIATGAVLLLGLVTSFDVRIGTGREMPAWDQSLQSAASSCRAEGIEEAVLPVIPTGWTMTIPCDRIDSEYPAAHERQPTTTS
jgi:hypothetical protein